MIKQSFALMCTALIFSACAVETDEHEDTDIELEEAQQAVGEAACRTVAISAPTSGQTFNAWETYYSGGMMCWRAMGASGAGYGYASCTDSYITDYVSPIGAIGAIKSEFSTAPPQPTGALAPLVCSGYSISQYAWSFTSAGWNALPTLTSNGVWTGTSCTFPVVNRTSVPSTSGGLTVTKIRTSTSGFNGGTKRNVRVTATRPLDCVPI